MNLERIFPSPKCVFPLPFPFFFPIKRLESISCPTNAVYPLGCETSAVRSPWLLELFLLAGSLRLYKEDFIKKLVAVQALV